MLPIAPLLHSHISGAWPAVVGGSTHALLPHTSHRLVGVVLRCAIHNAHGRTGTHALSQLAPISLDFLDARDVQVATVLSSCEGPTG